MSPPENAMAMMSGSPVLNGPTPGGMTDPAPPLPGRLPAPSSPTSRAPTVRAPTPDVAQRAVPEAWQTPLLLGGLLLLLTVAITQWGDASLQKVAAETWIRVVIVVGMAIFIGHSGITSFGHIAFVGIGAYAVAWTTMDPAIKPYVLPGLPEWLAQAAWPWVPASLAAGALAALLAGLVAVAILRLAGIAASIATFSLLAIFQVVASNWDSVTAGTSSIVGIGTPITPWNALAFAIATLFIAQAFAHSRHGLALRALREDPVAARSCGIRPLTPALLAFVLSAAVCGVGGALDAQTLGVVTPDSYYLGRTFITLAMLVVGGMTSLTGAVAGVLLISALTEVLRLLEGGVSWGALQLSIPQGSQEIMVGLVMIGMLIRRPQGWFGHTEWTWSRPLSPQSTSTSPEQGNAP